MSDFFSSRVSCSLCRVRIMGSLRISDDLKEMNRWIALNLIRVVLRWMFKENSSVLRSYLAEKRGKELSNWYWWKVWRESIIIALFFHWMRYCRISKTPFGSSLNTFRWDYRDFSSCRCISRRKDLIINPLLIEIDDRDDDDFLSSIVWMQLPFTGESLRAWLN